MFFASALEAATPFSAAVYLSVITSASLIPLTVRLPAGSSEVAASTLVTKGAFAETTTSLDAVDPLPSLTTAVTVSVKSPLLASSLPRLGTTLSPATKFLVSLHSKLLSPICTVVPSEVLPVTTALTES